MSRKEVWKKLEQFEGVEVSNHGRIKRLAYRSKTISGYERHYPTKFLKPRENKNSGLLFLTMKNIDNKLVSIYLHKAVAQLFVKNKTPRKRKLVTHIDGNLTNNHFSNLKWVTRSESLKNRYSHSSKEVRSKQGRKDPLNDELLDQAKKIREETGKSWQKIACEVGCSTSHLWKKIKEEEHQ